jgi:tRNA(Ile2) C34 agmatinyltransferase TiaS
MIVFRQIGMWHKHLFILLLLYNKKNHITSHHILVRIHHNTNYETPQNKALKIETRSAPNRENYNEIFSLSDQNHKKQTKTLQVK